ncbi:MAG: cytochrome c-type biogenesis protein CcmH [Myxococcota bacterium]
MRSPRMSSLALSLSALALCLSLSACSPADDPDSVRARQAHELARDLMSPFCPGRTLAECSSPDAGAIREEIRESLAAGESPESVRARIEARFGDHVVGVPRERLGWVLPILVLLAGAGALAFALRRAVQKPRASETAIPPELARELTRELDDVERR